MYQPSLFDNLYPMSRELSYERHARTQFNFLSPKITRQLYKRTEVFFKNVQLRYAKHHTFYTNQG
jgi:hypothetical protein